MKVMIVISSFMSGLLFAACGGDEHAGKAIPCQTDIECAVGYACIGGECHLMQLPDAGTTDAGGGCATDIDCPTNYRCRNGQCVSIPECTADADCQAGEKCVNGQCAEVGACANDVDCPAGYSCRNGRCAEVSECTADADCQAGEKCVNGQCAEVGACANDVECPAGYSCRNGQCVEPPECAADADCQAGEKCEDGACVPRGGCQTAADCAEGETCLNGACVPSARCFSDAQCEETEMCLNGNCVPRGGCTSDADCEEGHVCLNGVCVPETIGCLTDADCAQDEMCVDRECVTRQPGCTSDNQCPEGSICLNGACVRRPGCTTDANCGPGNVCVNGICQPEVECATDDDCNWDEICVNGACMVATECSTDDDCLFDEVCDYGYCVPAFECVTDDDCEIGSVCEYGICTPVNPDATVGDECASDADCQADGICIPSTYSDGSEGWPGGYCTAWCDEYTPCPDGSSCYYVGDDPSGYQITLCFTDCVPGQNDGCREDYACYEVDTGIGACVPGTGCSTDADCQAGEVCIGGVCTPSQECTTDADCAAGSVCRNGTCMPANPEATVGAGCVADADCQAGGLCIPATYSDGSEGWPGGYCTAWCDGYTPCPAGSTCYYVGDDTSGNQITLCFADCAPGQGGGCREEYACYETVPEEGLGACVPGSACASDADCAAGEACIGGVCITSTSCTTDEDCDAGETCVDGLCRSGTSSASVGSECAADSDCVTGQACIPDTGPQGEAGWPAGYCTAWCDAETPCPDGSTCYYAGDDSSGQPITICLDDCDPAQSDCREGYGCLEMYQDLGACVPSQCNQDADCRGGGDTTSVCGADGFCWCAGDNGCAAPDVCDVPTGECVNPGTAGAKMGEECAEDADCPRGGFCITEYEDPYTSDIYWTGGYCSAMCLDGQCPAGAACVDVGNSLTGEPLPICLDNCGQNDSCRQDYACYAPQQQQAVCISGTACETDDDCGYGEVCLDGVCQSEY